LWFQEQFTEFVPPVSRTTSFFEKIYLSSKTFLLFKVSDQPL